MDQAPKKRLEYLDSIRGLAALAVLLSHSFVFMWPQVVGQVKNMPFVNIPFNGKEAVAMFFVLSSYLLSRPYFGSGAPVHPGRSMNIPTFYIRRFARIWLPWLGAFCLSALAQVFLFRSWHTVPSQTGWLDLFWHVPLTAWNALRQGLFVLHDAKVQLVIQDWSLGVELKASILLPLLLFLCQRFTSWSLVALSTVMVVFAPMGPFYCSFMLGVLLAKHGAPVVKYMSPQPLAAKGALLIIGVIFYEAFHFIGDWLGHSSLGNYGLTATGIGCVLILLSSMSSRRIQATLHLPPIVFLGRISYSVYLLQFIVILCLLPAWIHLLNRWGIHRSLWLLPLSLAASVGVTVSLAAINYRWVELPCIELGHRMARMLPEKWAGLRVTTVAAPVKT